MRNNRCNSGSAAPNTQGNSAPTTVCPVITVPFKLRAISCEGLISAPSNGSKPVTNTVCNFVFILESIHEDDH